MILDLDHLEATSRLGEELARICTGPPHCPLLLEGDLGVGKTTLIRALVESLPGAELAEVSSPSFTLVNISPPPPPIAHLDLYRLMDASAEEDLLEYLVSGDHLVLAEWIDHLPRAYWPEFFLHAGISFREQGRIISLQGRGACEDAIKDLRF